MKSDKKKTNHDKDLMKIVIFEEKEISRLGYIKIVDEIVVPIETYYNNQFKNLFLVHYFEGVYYFAKKKDSEILDETKIKNLNDSFMFNVEEILGFKFSFEKEKNKFLVIDNYKFKIPESSGACFHSIMDLSKSLSR